MDLNLELFLAHCNIDYDSIWFYLGYWDNKRVYSYNELISNFVLYNLKVMSFRFDAIGDLIVIFDEV